MRRTSVPSMSKRNSIATTCSVSATLCATLCATPCTPPLAKHPLGGLDNHRHTVTGHQVEPLDGGACDGRDHILPANINGDFGHNAAELDLLYRPLQLIARAQFHGRAPLSALRTSRF